MRRFSNHYIPFICVILILESCSSLNKQVEYANKESSVYIDEKGQKFPIMPSYEYHTPNEEETVVDNTFAQALSLSIPNKFFDSIAFQGTIRNQQHRNSCVVFTLAAAMEAKLKKDGLNVDLSEQWMNHLTSTAFLDNIDRYNNSQKTEKQKNGYENALGIWGWNNNFYSVGTLFRDFYGVPEERLMPFISRATFENTRQVGDNPFVDWDLRNGEHTQREVNDFNLSQITKRISIPANMNINSLPQAAVENAEYRIENFIYGNMEQIRDPNWYESILSTGQEIAIAFPMPFSDPDKDGVLHVSSGPAGGGHAMLVIGYDKTDANNPYLIVKNSWGIGWGNAGLGKLGYDWITNDNGRGIGSAFYITGVEIVKPGTAQLAIGRWELEWEGQKGTLDINRIPEYKNIPEHPRNLRWGTYFDELGRLYRVNGFDIGGGKIRFYIDEDNRYANLTDIGGTNFTALISTENPLEMLGTFVKQGGSQQRFFATKPLGIRLQADIKPLRYRPNQEVQLTTTPSEFADAGSVITTWYHSRLGSQRRIKIGAVVGTSVLNTTLPCGKDIIIEAVAEDPNSGERAERIFVPECLSQSATTVVEASLRTSGIVNNDGLIKNFIGEEEFYIGDTAADSDQHALLTFVLPKNLSSSNFDSANLRLWTVNSLGNPKELGDVSIIRVDYGIELDAKDHLSNSLKTLSGPIVSISEKIGMQEVIVSDLVRETLKDGREVFQVAIFFETATNSNSKEDGLKISSTRPNTLLMPSLEITTNNF